MSGERSVPDWRDTTRRVTSRRGGNERSILIVKFVAVSLFATAVFSHTGASAKDDSWMSNEEIQKTFSGVTVEGRYGNGRPFTESYEESGRLSYNDTNRTSEGNWSIQTGTLCTIYDTDPSGGCFRVKKVGGNCFEFFFVARTVDKAHSDPVRPSWTARGSVAGQPGKCADEQTV